MQTQTNWLLFPMNFPERLVSFRKTRGFTQKALADAVGVHITQLRRYEAGTSQPTLEVLRKVIITLNISADALLFDENERATPDEQLQGQLSAVSRLGKKEQETIKTVIDGILLMHDAKKYASRNP